MIKALITSSLILNIGLLFGRISGFIREILVASTYGVTSEADIVVLLLTIPDVLVNILMGGAMGAALIPAFTRSPDQARKLLFQVMILITIIFSMIVLFCISYISEFVFIFAPGFSGEKLVVASQLLAWVLWLVPLTVLAGAITAYLQAQNRFAVPALGTLIINCTIILGLIYTQTSQSLRVLAIFILFGGLLRLLSQLSQVKWQWSPYKSLFPNLLERALLRRYFQAMVAGSILLLMPVIARAMASLDGDGSLAILNYALKLIEFPLTIAVSFIGIVLFPRIAKAFSEDIHLHYQLIRIGVQVTILLAIIAMVTLQTLSWDYVNVVYGYGKMDIVSQAHIAELITIGLLMLPLQGLAVFLTLIFNARNDMRKPMLINMVGLFCFVILTRLEGMSEDSLVSLMWALIISYGLICCLQLFNMKMNNFKWMEVLLDRNFLVGLITTVPLLYFVTFSLSLSAMPSWVVIILAAIASLAALFCIALMNPHIRNRLVVNLGHK